MEGLRRLLPQMEPSVAADPRTSSGIGIESSTEILLASSTEISSCGIPFLDRHALPYPALHSTPSPARFLSSINSSSVGYSVLKAFVNPSKNEDGAAAFLLLCAVG